MIWNDPLPWNERTRRGLKLKDLHVLIAVAEAGSMGSAARRLSMSQPAVSKAIADLERATGVLLLDRSRQGVETTSYGRALIESANAAFNELKHGVTHIDFLADPTAGEVSIGATEPVAAAIVSPVIRELNRQYPKMAFHVAIGDTGALLRLVAARTVDFAICRMSGSVDNEYHAEILFRDALVIAAGSANPLTRRRKITLRQLMGEPWAMGPGDSYFGGLQSDVFRIYGLTPPVATVSTGSVSLRYELLTSGPFLTVVPDFSLKLPRPQPFVRALHVDLSRTRMPVAIVTLNHRSTSPLAQLFMERIRALIKPLAK